MTQTNTTSLQKRFSERFQSALFSLPVRPFLRHTFVVIRLLCLARLQTKEIALFLNFSLTCNVLRFNVLQAQKKLRNSTKKVAKSFGGLKKSRTFAPQSSKKARLQNKVALVGY